MYEVINRIIVLIMLTLSAYTDIKERNIYLLPLLLGIMTSLLTDIAIMEFGTNDYEIVKEIMSRLALPILFSALIFIVVFLSNDQIGIGDAFLIAAVAVMTDVLPEIRILAISMCLCASYALFLLIIRRRNTEGIPFAPFMLAAYIVSLL